MPRPTPKASLYRLILSVLGRIVLTTSWLTCAVGTVLIVWVDVKSVGGTGPLLFLQGMLLCLLSMLALNWIGIVTSLAHMAVCLLFFLLVFLLRWSPGQAELPFAVMSPAYTFSALPLSVAAFIWWPRGSRFKPWQCQGCGYNLFHLTSNFCPECGKPFDPREVAQPPRDLVG
jgi:hypothetical protein